MKLFLVLFVVLLASSIAAQSGGEVHSLTVQPGEIVVQKPDLQVKGLFTHPAQLIAGKNFDVYVVVLNGGNVDVEIPYHIEFEKERGDIRVMKIDEPLPLGEERRYIFRDVPSFTETGSYNIHIKLDWSSRGEVKNLIDESNEENNFFIKKVSVIKGQEAAGDDGFTIKASERSDKDLVVILVVVGLIAIAAFALVYYTYRRRRGEEPVNEPTGNELVELQRERSELEEAIKIAKVKFYKRLLDEDSYKGIVKDNQERLIRIEAKIQKIQNDVNQLKKA
jgi:hypothetical protein